MILYLRVFFPVLLASGKDDCSQPLFIYVFRNGSIRCSSAVFKELTPCKHDSKKLRCPLTTAVKLYTIFVICTCKRWRKPDDAEKHEVLKEIVSDIIQ